MKPFHGPLGPQSFMPIHFILVFSLFSVTVNAADQCQPITWVKNGVSRNSVASQALIPTISNSSSSVADVGCAEPGQINCRYFSSTYADVNYYTCTQLADRYDIDIDLFFELNPDVKKDCTNIQPYTEYCVDGCECSPGFMSYYADILLIFQQRGTVIEPLRSTDGLCGPENNNATCLGTAHQCCNAHTWTCGSSA